MGTDYDATCVFCRIAKRELPSDIVYESPTVIAFNDIQPAAPHHVLVVSRRHLESVYELSNAEADLSRDLFSAVRNIVDHLGLKEQGYRVVTNVGDWGGQTVHHLHFHVLGGRKLGSMG